MVATNFDRCLKPLLVHEGGNDDDPQDPGGRTSRGIIQSEYDVWRSRQGLARRDVWTADDAEVRAIYFTEYWERMRCDDLPSGVDYAVFDYGVNSGIYHSARSLQIAAGATPDGQIGPKTLAAVSGRASTSIVIAISTERLAFLSGLKTWARFGRGWATRVTDVERDALQMVKDAAHA